jgi:multidrug efflux pump subunit AcrA (membrane-fusion protein)
MVEVGDTVQPGQPLYKFADIQYLQIRVEVPSRLMPGLRKGQLLRARLDVGNFDIRVRVAQIFPVADPRRHTVTVKFDVPINAPAAPGMYANAWVPDPNAQTRDMVVIPTSALVYRGSLPAVYVLDPQSQKYELRVVRIGESVDQEHVTIITGLSAGDMILNHPRDPDATDWSPGFSPAPTPSQPTTPQYYIQG